MGRGNRKDRRRAAAPRADRSPSPSFWDRTKVWRCVFGILIAVIPAFIGWEQARARVSIPTIIMPELPQTGATLKAEVQIKNGGSTTAHDLIAQTCMKPMASLPDTLECPISSPHSKLDLGQGDICVQALVADLPTSQLLFDQLQSGIVTWFVWGTVMYKDFLGLNHHTNFCVQYQPNAPNPRVLAACPIHNDSR